MVVARSEEEEEETRSRQCETTEGEEVECVVRRIRLSDVKLLVYHNFNSITNDLRRYLLETEKFPKSDKWITLSALLVFPRTLAALSSVIFVLIQVFLGHGIFVEVCKDHCLRFEYEPAVEEVQAII